MINFANLPSEIIWLIADRVHQEDLYACTLVSTRFYVIFNQLLWRTIVLENRTIADHFFDCLFKAQHPVGEYIRSIDSATFQWTDETLINLAHRARRLETLNLIECRQITDKSMQQLPYYCPNLISLIMLHGQITQLSFRALAQYCHQLTKLQLGFNLDLPPETYSAIVNCPLEELGIYMPHCERILDEWKSTKTTLDLTGLHGLKNLSIYGRPLDLLDRAITTSETNGSPCWPHLTSFSLKYASVSNDIVVRALKTFPGLKHLELPHWHLTDATLDVIATFQPAITKVDLSFNNDLTYHGVRRLAQGCPQLTWMELTHCKIMVDDLPEAGKLCCRLRRSPCHPNCWVNYLDQEALDNIRFASHFSEEDEND
ncbi:unnamed protein product [Absidia cylindrospora]